MGWMGEEHYTFGDTDAAGARLRRLGEAYEPETRELRVVIVGENHGIGEGVTAEPDKVLTYSGKEIHATFPAGADQRI
jgi:hypothetical protein